MRRHGARPDEINEPTYGKALIMARDRLNQEKHEQNDGVGAKIGKALRNAPGIRQLRDKLGGVASDNANNIIFGYTPTNANPPSQVQGLAKTSMTFNNPSTGNPEVVNGFHLPATQGQPTVVFFGGSNYDRSDPDYQAAIRKMATEAKAKGMGFVTFDYPSARTEAEITAYVDQLQTHLVTQGIPGDQQAYSGYSLGGFPATYAAKQNPQAAGLQLTSTFSAIRQVSKEAMKESYPTLGKIIATHKFVTMDNIANLDDIAQQQTQRVNQGQRPMPIATLTSASEDFGKLGNKHMDAIQTRLNNKYPGGNNHVSSTVLAPTHAESHESIIKSQHQQQEFGSFLTSVGTYQQARGLAPVPQAVNQVPPNQPPVTQVQPNQVPPNQPQPTVAHQTLRDSLGKGKEAKVQPERLSRSNSVGEKIGKKPDQVKQDEGVQIGRSRAKSL
jgi:hypothetical protein